MDKYAQQYKPKTARLTSEGFFVDLLIRPNPWADLDQTMLGHCCREEVTEGVSKRVGV